MIFLHHFLLEYYVNVSTRFLNAQLSVISFLFPRFHSLFLIFIYLWLLRFYYCIVFLVKSNLNYCPVVQNPKIQYRLRGSKYCHREISFTYSIFYTSIRVELAGIPFSEKTIVRTMHLLSISLLVFFFLFELER
jgi:hypothetical protein